MSAPVSATAELRRAVLTALKADYDVTALVGTRLYDRPPAGAQHPFVSFGPAQAIEDDFGASRGLELFQQLDAWSQTQGATLEADRLVQALSDALHEAALTLADPWALHEIRVTRAEVIDDPEPGLAHGIVTLRALVQRVD